MNLFSEVERRTSNYIYYVALKDLPLADQDIWEPDKSDKPFQPSLISPDTVYIPIGNYSGLSYEQQQEQENSNDIPTNRD